MIHDGPSDCPLPTPPTRPSHTLEYALIIRFKLTKPRPVLDLEPKEVDARPRIFFGIVSALAARLDLAVTPFFGEPCEAGFEWSTTGMVVHECCIDAEWVADAESFEVGFEGVANEDGGWAIWGCEEGKDLGLDFGEGSFGCGEGCLGDA